MARKKPGTLTEVQEESLPSRLTSSEKAHPEMVVADFFNFATLAQARASLSSWLSASLQVPGDDQFEYIHLWQQLERLIEANWLLNEQRSDKESVEETA